MKKIVFGLSLLFIILSVKAVSAQDAAAGSFYTSWDGAKIYYEVKGDGYPVILIHGFSGTSQGWKNGPLYADLINAGYKVIILDLRGNGRSDKPHTDAGYADNAEAKDIIGLASNLNIKQYYIVGYSRGSIIASSLMVMDKRVKKTVMGGMGEDYTNPNWPRRIHAYKALMGDTSFHDVDGMMKYIHANPFDEVALGYQQKYQPSTSKAKLAKIKIPVLIIRGTEDKENGSETGLQQLIPNAKLSYVPGDHNSAGRSKEFSDDVIAFFK